MIIYGFVTYQSQRLTYDDGSLYPDWVDAVGNLMNCATVLSILAYFVYKVVKTLLNNEVHFAEEFYIE